MMNVCQHTEQGKTSCDNCHSPFPHRANKINGKFNWLFNSISHLRITDTANSELVEAFASAIR